MEKINTVTNDEREIFSAELFKIQMFKPDVVRLTAAKK